MKLSSIRGSDNLTVSNKNRRAHHSLIFLSFPPTPKQVILKFIKILLIIYQCIVTEIDRSITKKYVIQPESVNYHKKET